MNDGISIRKGLGRFRNQFANGLPDNRHQKPSFAGIQILLYFSNPVRWA
jgi:hypothetical protein